MYIFKYITKGLSMNSFQKRFLKNILRIFFDNCLSRNIRLSKDFLPRTAKATDVDIFSNSLWLSFQRVLKTETRICKNTLKYFLSISLLGTAEASN